MPSKPSSILEILSKLSHTLQSSETKAQLDMFIRDLCLLKAESLDQAIATLSPQEKEQCEILFIGILDSLRDRLFTLLTNGILCGVEYFFIIILLPHAKGLKADSRFEVFIQMAKKHLFSDGVSDVENAFFVEVYTLARILASQGGVGTERDSILREYITLVSLLDINLPSSLQHSTFVVECFTSLNVNIEILISALKAQLSKQSFFAYPPFRRRSILNWQLHCFWNVAHFFNHPLWLELYPLWRDLFYQLLEQGDIQSLDEAMYLQFFMYHICGNSFHAQQQWRRFCEEIDQVGVRHYERFAKNQGIYGGSQAVQTTDSQKILIGILRDRLVTNSPFKVEYSLLSNLLSDQEFSQKYEFRIYAMKLLEKSQDDELIVQAYESLGVRVVDVVSPLNAQGFYNSHLQKALAIKSAMNNDGVQILISPNNGYGISDFLLASRSAHTQFYYSHGNFVYDLPCIDQRITHICQNKRQIIHEGFEFSGIPLKMLERFYNPQVPDEMVRACREKFPSDVVIVGTIGRLTKLDSLEYWQCVIGAMREYPKSIYLACGGGNTSVITQRIQQCFESEIESEAFLQRVYFEGYVQSEIYGHIIDIWLDSFPHEQGESRIEYVAKGGLSLVMSKRSPQEREMHLKDWVAKWAKMNNVEYLSEQCESFQKLFIESHLPLVAFDTCDYQRKASDLLGLFIQALDGNQSAKEQIQNLKSIVAQGRKLNDEMREKEGVQAFKEIIAQNSKD